ncbi:DoxX family protein [Plantibacter sp. Leaf314]|uniref:DoxX family protein n=1 Tax=Plantibacter sp. Leaf314 TaxID=1736333 RepID=UPI0009E7533E|nr:DoxX family protein [Plantibacter sp. Leaf314]
MNPFSILQSILTIVLALMFVGMGLLHFLPGPGRTMAAMIPDRLRGTTVTPRMLVLFTGVCEIAGGLGLLIPATRIAAVCCLIVFLIAVFPANAAAARQPARFGRLAVPLVPRLIGQLVLIAALVAVAI